MPFRIFFRIGNDSSFGILAGGLLARLRPALFLRKFRPDYPVLPKLLRTLYEGDSHPQIFCKVLMREECTTTGLWIARFAGNAFCDDGGGIKGNLEKAGRMFVR